MIDAEHAFDADYAAKLGVDVDKLIVCQPESGEMALEGKYLVAKVKSHVLEKCRQHLEPKHK